MPSSALQFDGLTTITWSLGPAVEVTVVVDVVVVVVLVETVFVLLDEEVVETVDVLDVHVATASSPSPPP